VASKLETDHVGNNWQRFPIRRIEDLRNAVFGAELEATQMAGPRLRGSLVFGASHGIVFSSGLIGGKVALQGALAEDAITLSLGLRLGRESRQWLSTVGDGDVAVHLPGDELDAIYGAGSLYVAATLTEERLAVEAECNGLPLEKRLLRGTGLYPIAVPAATMAQIARQVAIRHGSGSDGVTPGLGDEVLRVMLDHFSRRPSGGHGRVQPRGRARIVRLAREHIRENLAKPIHMRDLAVAAGTSVRTLHRSFVEVLEETPHGFVRRLRLHRIRRELVSGSEISGTVASVAGRWSPGRDLGRLSGHYRALFGETPSATRALNFARAESGEWL